MVCCVTDGRWMSSVRAWCMAVCCVSDGRWRQWMSSVRAWCVAVWPCVVSVMVGGGGG